MAVVKANAYGHGLVPAARILLRAGVDRLAVATLAEGLELRAAAVDAPILVLGYTPPWLAQLAVQQAITVTVFDREVAHSLEEAATALDRPATVQVKVNTGMNRLGLPAPRVPEFIDQLRGLRHLLVEGIFTHFATADLADKEFAWAQFTRFTDLLQCLQSAGLRPRFAHAANSAAMLTMPATYLDLVRCGIALYGLHPDDVETRLPVGFQPALRWKAVVAQVAQIQPGESVSYGREFVATQPMTIAVLPVGYADGFPRRPYHWGHVLIHGHPAPILGRVCMDQSIVDVTAFAPAGRPVRQGDEVILLGPQGAAGLSAEAIAERLHTNNYDVVSRILDRVPRMVVNERLPGDHQR